MLFKGSFLTYYLGNAKYSEPCEQYFHLTVTKIRNREWRMGNGKAVTENESAAPKVQEQERDFPSVVNTESNSKK